MRFTGSCAGHSTTMDATQPFGEHAAPTPKELLAVAIAGCTGMDVVALLKKYKQPLESLEITVDAPIVEAQPPIFKSVELTFTFKGQMDRQKVTEAVHLSQTKFCAVSAMISKTVPIHYKIFLNEEPIDVGESHFDSLKTI